METFIRFWQRGALCSDFILIRAFFFIHFFLFFFTFLQTFFSLALVSVALSTNRGIDC